MRSARRWTALALVATVVAVYVQAAGFPLLCWDDNYHLTAPLSFATPALGYPIPLTVASWALLGRSALAAHAGNVALHAACALGVLALAWQLGRRAWPAF